MSTLYNIFIFTYFGDTREESFCFYGSGQEVEGAPYIAHRLDYRSQCISLMRKKNDLSRFTSKIKNKVFAIFEDFFGQSWIYRERRKKLTNIK